MRWYGEDSGTRPTSCKPTVNLTCGCWRLVQYVLIILLDLVVYEEQLAALPVQGAATTVFVKS